MSARTYDDVTHVTAGVKVVCGSCGQLRARYARGLCTSCYRHARRDGSLADFPKAWMSRDELADEVELLLAGRSPEDVARVLGRTVSTVARAMYRAGRPDLARPFRRLENAARRRSEAA